MFKMSYTLYNYHHHSFITITNITPFRFPTEYLGRLYGMTSIVNAVMTVIQFPLFVATEGSKLGIYVGFYNQIKHQKCGGEGKGRDGRSEGVNNHDTRTLDTQRFIWDFANFR